MTGSVSLLKHLQCRLDGSKSSSPRIRELIDYFGPFLISNLIKESIKQVQMHIPDWTPESAEDYYGVSRSLSTPKSLRHSLEMIIQTIAFNKFILPHNSADKIAKVLKLAEQIDNNDYISQNYTNLIRALFYTALIPMVEEAALAMSVWFQFLNKNGLEDNDRIRLQLLWEDDHNLKPELMNHLQEYESSIEMLKLAILIDSLVITHELFGSNIFIQAKPANQRRITSTDKFLGELGQTSDLSARVANTILTEDFDYLRDRFSLSLGTMLSGVNTQLLLTFSFLNDYVYEQVKEYYLSLIPEGTAIPPIESVINELNLWETYLHQMHHRYVSPLAHTHLQAMVRITEKLGSDTSPSLISAYKSAVIEMHELYASEPSIAGQGYIEAIEENYQITLTNGQVAAVTEMLRGMFSELKEETYDDIPLFEYDNKYRIARVRCESLKAKLKLIKIVNKYLIILNNAVAKFIGKKTSFGTTEKCPAVQIEVVATNGEEAYPVSGIVAVMNILSPVLKQYTRRKAAKIFKSYSRNT